MRLGRRCHHLALGFALIALVMAGCAAPAATVRGTVTATGSMVTARRYATATLLRDGRVLVVGGMAYTSADFSASAFPASAELYDPKTGAFVATGSMAEGRTGHTATLLANGKVLVAGGAGSAAAELYDPATGVFSPTGSMTTERAGHSATLLPDGRVLIAGGQQGQNDNTGYLASAELYDPASGTFTTTGSMTTKRADHSATLLLDGRVLIAGGAGQVGDYGMTVAKSAELYDAKTGTFIPTGSMHSPGKGDSAILLPDGRALILGGASGELYDPKSGAFSATVSLKDAASPATLLPDGRVFVIVTDGPAYALELYDPASGTFAWRYETELDDISTSTLLQDGRVLITCDGPNPTIGRAFLFQP